MDIGAQIFDIAVVATDYDQCLIQIHPRHRRPQVSIQVLQTFHCHLLVLPVANMVGEKIFEHGKIILSRHPGSTCTCLLRFLPGNGITGRHQASTADIMVDRLTGKQVIYGAKHQPTAHHRHSGSRRFVSVPGHLHKKAVPVGVDECGPEPPFCKNLKDTIGVQQVAQYFRWEGVDVPAAVGGSVHTGKERSLPCGALRNARHT